jgi:peptide/nickel transport system substrate-binding protein
MPRFVIHLVLVGLASATLALTACMRKTAPCSPRDTPPLRIAIANPRVAQLALSEAFAIGAYTEMPLIWMDTYGQTHPGLAASWETPDRRTWTFTLRPNLKSHSGTPLTAALLRQTILDDIADPIHFIAVWQDLQSIDAPAPDRLVLHFARPISMLPEALRALPVYHPDRYQIDHDRHTDSAGPWRITHSARDALDLETFPPGSSPAGSPTHLHFAAYRSARAAYAAFLRNETDVLDQVPRATIPLLMQNPDIRLYGSPLSRVATFMFNLKSPWLRDVRVRQAINLAIDRDEVERYVYADLPEVTRRSKPVMGPFSPDLWAAAGIASPWHTDLVAARALLKEATRGHSEPIEIVCLTSSEYQEVADLGAIVEAQLQRVHIRLRLEPLPYKPLTSRLASGDFDAILAPLVTGSGTLYPYLDWHSGTRAMGFGRDNTDYAGADTAFDRLRFAPTPEAERTAFREVIDALYRDPPAAFLVPIRYIRAVRKTWRVPNDEPDIRYSIKRWTFDAPCDAS